MVYKRYIYKNGKKYGPYLYKSVRVKNKVKNVYLKNLSKKSKRKAVKKSDDRKPAIQKKRSFFGFLRKR